METAIVAFIDILGYKQLINEYIDNHSVIVALQDVMEIATTKYTEAIKESEAFSTPELESYFQQMVDITTVKFLSDSIIFTLPVSKITFTYNDYSVRDVIEHCIYYLWGRIAKFCDSFIYQTGHVLRGGIAMGPHCEAEIGGNNLFIFSQAFIKAVELERQAKMPRILIDSQLLEYLHGLPFSAEYTGQFFYTDSDQRVCFHVYSKLDDELKRRDESLYKNIFATLKRGISGNLKKNANNPKEKEYLEYFASYHNSQVKQRGLGEELLV